MEVTGKHKSCIGKDRRKHHLEDLSIDGKIIVSWGFMSKILNAWIGFVCPTIRTNGELL
jgi:hypothetical protein